MAGAGLEQIAPNLLLFIVLQEYQSDVPTLFPTLGTKTTVFDRALAPDLQHSDGIATFPSVAQLPPYTIEVDTPSNRSVAGGTDGILTSNTERIQS